MLKESAEPEYVAFSSKLIPGKEGIIGVRIPTIRNIARLIIKDDWESYLEDPMTSFEEEMLRGIVIATAPMNVERRISLTEGFLPAIDNWSTCDSFCTSWKFPKKDSDRVHDYFASLIGTDSEFRMRVSVIFRMAQFKDEIRIKRLLDDIIAYDHEGYYYKMGAAWAVSVCYIRFPELTRPYLESPEMDNWVCNKSIQKIRESYRVSKEDKESLKALKRV